MACKRSTSCLPERVDTAMKKDIYLHAKPCMQSRKSWTKLANCRFFQIFGWLTEFASWYPD